MSYEILKFSSPRACLPAGRSLSYNQILKRPFFFFLYILLLFPIQIFALDKDFTVFPEVIDFKTKGRAFLEDAVKIKNSSDHKVNFFVYVKDVPSAKDKSEAGSLSDWLRIPRQFELNAGEEKELALKIEMSPYVKPGSYHALIIFSKTTIADLDNLAGDTGVIFVNLDVSEDKNENIQLNSFVVAGSFFNSFPISLSYELENIGNTELAPGGSIRFYDSKGKETGELLINKDKNIVKPGEIMNMKGTWNGDSSFGSYKAFFRVKYGEEGKEIYDTQFFRVLPVYKIAGLFIISLLVILFGVNLLYEKFFR